jgi:phosphatidate cytidylyltransferase
LGAEQATTRPYEASRSRRTPDARRLYVALVFVPFFYVLVRYTPTSAFFLLVTAAALLALWEFYRLYFRDRRVTASMVLGFGAAVATLVSLQWPWIVSDRTVLLLTVIAVLSYRLLCTRDLRQSLEDSAVLIFGVTYIALTLGCLLLTRALPEGEFLVLFLFLVTWAADTGAYYVGTSVGRHRLAPVISPNKTVEGLVGGVMLALGAALLARMWFLPSFSVTECLVAGALLTIAGVTGDLTESALKRSAGVKDSGVVLPGHGGMLDRLDSLLFTSPVFYYYVTLVKG